MIARSWIVMSLFSQETDQNIANGHISQTFHMLQKLNILQETKFARILHFCNPFDGLLIGHHFWQS